MVLRIWLEEKNQIVKLKSQVRAEEIKNSKVRGGGEMNPFELPKKKL